VVGLSVCVGICVRLVGLDALALCNSGRGAQLDVP